MTDEVAQALAERTDGNPFHVTELVRLLVGEGALTSRDASAWRAVPGGVRDVVRQRLGQDEAIERFEHEGDAPHAVERPVLVKADAMAAAAGVDADEVEELRRP